MSPSYNQSEAEVNKMDQNGVIRLQEFFPLQDGSQYIRQGQEPQQYHNVDHRTEQQHHQQPQPQHNKQPKNNPGNQKMTITVTPKIAELICLTAKGRRVCEGAEGRFQVDGPATAAEHLGLVGS